MQVEHWIKMANFRHKLHFVDSLAQSCFAKQQYKQMMQQPEQSQPIVCCFYTIYAAFHLFKLQQEEITGVYKVIVLSRKSSYM